MITIINKPQKFTPASNDSIFQIESSDLYFRYFLVEVVNATTLEVVSTLKLRPTPVYRNGVFTNLVDILSEYVSTTLVKNNDIIAYTNDVFKYSLRVKEYIAEVETINTGTIPITRPTGIMIINQTLLLEGFYIFNAKLPLDKYAEYDYTSIIANNAGTGMFLTRKPTKSIIQNKSTEYLYYLNDNRADKVRFRLYYDSGALVTKTVALTKTRLSGRINISLACLKGNAVDLTGLKYYVIDLLDSDNNVAVSPVSRVLYNPCSISNLNVFWLNEMGGYDSYLFKNIRETVTTTKINTTNSPYKRIGGGKYGTLNDNIFNETDVTLQSDSVSSFTVASEFLSNDESKWIVGLLRSKKVYVELATGKLYPVQVKDNTAAIQNSRYDSNTPLQFEFSFTMPTGIELDVASGSYFPYDLPIQF